MNFHPYPIQKTESSCTDYRVWVNGEEVALDTARVSKAPINRRWPGHQRSKDQSELINFLSASADGPLEIEILPPVPSEKAEIRPRSLGVEPRLTGEGKFCFTLPAPAYFTFEPYGRMQALHFFIDPIKDYGIDPADENVLYFGPGEHDAGMIRLQSGQILYLAEGAVVYGCVHAIDAERIRILGRGILDNSRNQEKILFEYSAEGNQVAINNAERIHTVQLEYCTDIEIDGITIRDSLVYNIRPIGCEGLAIRNVKIIGCWRYNSDGIDMHNCKKVLIEDCFIRTFDDSICVKGFDCYYEGDVEKAIQAAMYRGGKAYDTFEDTLIRRCTIWNDWGKCLEIGAETRAEEIFGINFEDCDCIHTTGVALDCMNVDYALVHDILYRNIRVEYDDPQPKPMVQRKDDEEYRNTDPDYAPLLIAVISCFHPEYSAGGTRRGINRRITFENIQYFSRQQPRLVFEGADAEHLTEEILIKDLYWNGRLLPSLEEAQCTAREFTRDICYRAAAYEQMEKNTVDAARQLENCAHIRFVNPNGRGKRILFLGNSITLHGVKAEIGWHHEWGMAASALEKDYVHLLMKMTEEQEPDAAFCICQVSEWERQYKCGEEIYSSFEPARAFGADIIVARFIENCPKADFDGQIFKTAYRRFLEFFDPSKKAKIILTTGFWHHHGDPLVIELAKEQGLPLVTLGDLGEQNEMKAIGLFDHSGVANHPGDLGMQAIAQRIFLVMKESF